MFSFIKRKFLLPRRSRTKLERFGVCKTKHLIFRVFDFSFINCSVFSCYIFFKKGRKEKKRKEKEKEINVLWSFIHFSQFSFFLESSFQMFLCVRESKWLLNTLSPLRICEKISAKFKFLYLFPLYYLCISKCLLYIYVLEFIIFMF